MLRRFFLLLALLPALCLGLLGQGGGLVLCQEGCGCVAIEMAHAQGEHRHADCGHADGDHVDGGHGCACGHDHGQGEGACRDLALDAGDHVAPEAVKLPDLTAYPCGHFVLAWVAPVEAHAFAAGLHSQASWRGPPEASRTPPASLSALRTVVLLV